jgi:5'-3' exonuclease
MVLPQQSKSLLPREIGNLMTDIESDIIEYFPNKYEIECVNKYYLYECPPLLPRIIISNIRDAIKSCKTSLQEKERNKFGKLFIKS